MKKITVLFLLFGICSLINAQSKNLPYQNSKIPIEKRVENLLSLMTLEEKIDLLGGTGFATKPNERLNIPPLNMTDGPLGVRWDKATAFPSGIALGSTWEPGLIYKVGKAIAEEVKAKGRHVILGPCVNIARIPQGGRNFESFGEDPYLTSQMGINYIMGVQSENVVATVKHFACNNQEHERMFVNTLVDKRALNEIYLPAFKAAVTEADVLAVMSAYNKINDHFASENDTFLIDILKKDWKFKGIVMSDWGAVHSSIPTFNSGLDLEMPTGAYLNQESLLKGLLNGSLDVKKLNDKVKRILTVMFKIGLFDDYKYDESKLNNEEHKQLAYESAVKSIVLLKNNYDILPLNTDVIKSIAVIGPNAGYARTGGGGSSQVLPYYSIAPLEALRNKIGNIAEINYAPGVVFEGDEKSIDGKFFFTDSEGKSSGLKVSYFNNKKLEGSPVSESIVPNIQFYWGDESPAQGVNKDNYSARFEGYLKAPKSGLYKINVASDDGNKLYFEDELVINDWNDHGEMTTTFEVELQKDKLYKFALEYYENVGSAVVKMGWQLPGEDLIKNAMDVAKNSDLVLLFVGTSNYDESEGKDRESLDLPGGQDKLIDKILEANSNVILVVTSGSPVNITKWTDKVPAIIQSFFSGQEIGNAIADVIIGKYNPAGKLPISYPKAWEDCSAFNSYRKIDGTTEYSDGIYVGYRHFQKNNIKPLFPFGFGLSYTSYEYSNLSVTKEKKQYKVTFNIKNVGKYEGAEISQLYIAPIDSKIDKPVKELKRFNKVYLKPNEEKTITMHFSVDDLRYFDVKSDNWKLESGKYNIQIGSSSENIKLENSIEVK